MAVYSSSFFNESYELSIFDGYVDAPTDAQIFLAYQIEGGELIYTPLPFQLTVE